MSTSQKVRCGVYALFAAIGLVVTWTQSIAYTHGSFIDYQRDFWTDTKATAASRTMTAELLVVGAAIIILCVTEGRRWGVRFVWLYALGSLLIGVSVGVPLFLIARERRMAAVDAPPTTPADSVLLTLLCIGLTSLALWVAFS